MNYFYLHTTNSITLVLAGNTIKLSLTFQRFLNAKSLYVLRTFPPLLSITVFSFKNQFSLFGVP